MPTGSQSGVPQSSHWLRPSLLSPLPRSMDPAGFCTFPCLPWRAGGLLRWWPVFTQLLHPSWLDLSRVGGSVRLLWAAPLGAGGLGASSLTHPAALSFWSLTWAGYGAAASLVLRAAVGSAWLMWPRGLGSLDLALGWVRGAGYKTPWRSVQGEAGVPGTQPCAEGGPCAEWGPAGRAWGLPAPS